VRNKLEHLMSFPVNRYWPLLVRYLRPHWPRLLLLAVLLVAGIAGQLLAPQFIRSFLDTATSSGSLTSLLVFAILFCLVALAGEACAVGATYVSTQLGWLATNALRVDLTDHCLRLDLPFHHAHPPGELIERLDGDVRELRSFFSEFSIQLLSNLLLVLGVLLLLVREDWRIGAVFMVFTTLTLLVLHRIRNVASPFWQAAQQANAELYARSEDWLGGLADLRTSGAVPYVRAHFAAALRTQFRRQRQALAMSVIVGNGAELLLVLGTIGALAIGIALFQAGQATIGTVYLVTAYASLLNRPLQQLIRQVDDLQRATASIVRINALADTRSTITDGAQTLAPSGGMPLTFTHVSFQYPSSVSQDERDTSEPSLNLALRDISFRLEPGEILGLIGRTGSGKSTLVRLALRLYDPTAGTISLNDVDIRALRLADLRVQIGVVTQDVQLFHATVRENVTLFDPAIPDARILSAIDALALGRWFTSLPHGLDTLIGPGGAGLSAGEAQLLAVVRVFSRDPALVILDEASARLDPVTERLVEQAFDRLLHPPGGRRTAIIIAHRLRTVQQADTILVLERGAIQEYGSRQALAQDAGSVFRRLLETGEDALA
jgi:ATP-binding cassette subfamily B protein/ATP-binding cassette subfamily C protein